jgi:hypothetical protein
VTRHTGRVDHRPLAHSVTGPPRVRGAAHAARPVPDPRRLIAGVLGGAAALAVLGLGMAACLTTLDRSTSTPTSAQSITVTPSTGRPANGP